MLPDMRPRRRQTPISFRSDRAAARLAVLTQGGLSQAEIIEDALERVPIRRSPDEQARWDRIMAILEKVDPSTIPTMAEFDAQEYDERGNPR